MFTYFVSTEKHRYLLVHQPPRNGYILGAIGIMAVSWPLVNWLIELNGSVQLPEFMGGMEESMQKMEQSAAEKFQVMQAGSSVGNLLLNIFLIAVLPAVGEELVFRGIIQKLLSRWTNSIHWAVWITGALFSFFHFQFYGFLPRMLLGVLFGYLLVWSGTIWVPIIVHFFNNAVALILHWLIEQGTIPADVDDFGSTGNFVALALAAVILSVALFFYRRKSRWQTIEYEYMKH
jgi:membrane protease YdiL (CAAX protease family)